MMHIATHQLTYFLFLCLDCIIRPPLQAPPMQHSLSLPSDIPFNSNNDDNDIHPLYTAAPSSTIRPAFLDTKSMTSLPLPTASTSSPSSSAFYANPSSSKSMVQVGQQPQQDHLFSSSAAANSSSSNRTTSSTTSSSFKGGIRRNKTLPSKNSKSTSESSPAPPPPPPAFYSQNTTTTFSKPAWLDRSNSTASIRRERQYSMPMTNQKTPVRRWKSIRTVPQVDQDAPISTQ